MIARLRTALLAALMLCGVSGAAAQETSVITGTVVDMRGDPVADQEVVLHRLAGQDGDRVGEATTDDAGRFSFTVDGEQPAGALFFATARFMDGTYIGPIIELPLDPDFAYEVEVGGVPISFDATTMPPTTMPPASGSLAEVRPPASPRRWALAIIPLIALIGLGAATLARRSKQARRTLLIRLAVLEEDAAANGETEGLQRERARILERLGGGPGN